MKTTLRALLIAISVGCLSTANADMFPPVDLTCSSDKEVGIFENHTNSDALLIIQGSDHCTGGDSVIIVHTKAPLSDIKLWIPDGTTKTFSVAVSASMKVGFKCNGHGDGKCTYVIARQ